MADQGHQVNNIDHPPSDSAGQQEGRADTSSQQHESSQYDNNNNDTNNNNTNTGGGDDNLLDYPSHDELDNILPELTGSEGTDLSQLLSLDVLPLLLLGQRPSTLPDQNRTHVPIPSWYQQSHANTRSQNDVKISTQDAENVLAAILQAETAVQHPILGTSSLHFTITSFCSADENNSNELLQLDTINSIKLEVKHYKASCISIKIINECLIWIGADTLLDPDTVGLTEGIETCIRIMQQTVPFYGTKKEMITWIKARHEWRGINTGDLHAWVSTASNAELREFMVNNFAVNSRIIIHVVDGMHRLLGYLSAMIGAVPEKARWMDTLASDYLKDIEHPGSQKSTLAKGECHCTIYIPDPYSNDDQLVSYFDKCNAISAKEQRNNEKQAPHTQKHFINLLLARLHRKVQNEQFSFLLEDDNTQGLGLAMGGGITDEASFNRLLRGSGIAQELVAEMKDGNGYRIGRHHSYTIQFDPLNIQSPVDVVHAYMAMWMYTFEHIIVEVLGDILKEYGEETVQHMTGNLDLHKLDQENVAMFFLGKVFPLEKKDCFAMVHLVGGNHSFQSKNRYKNTKSEGKGCIGDQAQLVMLIRSAFFSREIFDATKEFVQSNDCILKQLSVGKRSDVATLLRCVTQCISGQCFTARKLFESANVSHGRKLFFKRERKTKNPKMFQQASPETRDVLFVISATADVLKFFKGSGNNPEWSPALVEESDRICVRIGDASENGTKDAFKNSKLNKLVADNVNVMLGVTYSAFLHQFQLMAVQLGKEAFSDWIRDWIHTIRSLSRDGILLEGIQTRSLQPRDIGSFSEGGHGSVDPRRKGSIGSRHLSGQMICSPDFIRMNTVLSDLNDPNSWKLNIRGGWSFHDGSLRLLFPSSSLPPLHLHHPVASDMSTQTASWLQTCEEQATEKSGMDIPLTTQLEVSQNGLENSARSNICWLNSMLQVMVNIPFLQYYLGGRSYWGDLNSNTVPGESFTIRLAAFLQYSLESENTMSAKNVLELLQLGDDIGAHQDPYERALLPIFGALERETGGSDDLSWNDFSAPVEGSIQDAANSFWDKYTETNTSPFMAQKTAVEVEIKTGTCPHCNTEINSQKFLPLPELLVPVPETQQCTLESCLETLVQPEKLSEYKCPECGMDADVTKCVHIVRRPSLVTMVFRRFNWTKGGAEKKKVDVQFQLDGNDLSEFMMPAPGERADAVYDVLAICNHHGDVMKSGHCTAIVRHFPSDTFHRFDDSHHEVVSRGNIFSGDGSEYIVFMIRRDISCQLTSLAEVEGSSSEDESIGNGGVVPQGGGTSGTSTGEGGTGMSGEHSRVPAKSNVEKRPRPTRNDKEQIQGVSVRNPPGTRLAMETTFKNLMGTLLVLEDKLERRDDMKYLDEDALKRMFTRNPSLWGTLLGLVQQSCPHIEKYHKMCGRNKESNKEPSGHGTLLERAEDEEQEGAESEDQDSSNDEGDETSSDEEKVQELRDEDNGNNNIRGKQGRGKGKSG